MQGRHSATVPFPFPVIVARVFGGRWWLHARLILATDIFFSKLRLRKSLTVTLSCEVLLRARKLA